MKGNKMRPSNKLLIAVTVLAVAIMAVACGNTVTGLENEAGTDPGARTVMFMVTGSMKMCDYFSYTDSDSTSFIIDDCMVPFYVTVTLPENTILQVSAGKRADEACITVCIVENDTIIGSDTALEGETFAWWTENQ